MAIITYPLNGISYGAEDIETYLCTRTSGVFDSSIDFAASLTGNRQITIGTGLAWIRNEAFAGKSVCNKENVVLNFDLADGTLNRIDRIVLRFNKAQRSSNIMILKGTPATNPSAPAVSRTSDVYDLGLYTVYLPAGSTVIAQDNITDTRGDAAVCGRVGDGVSGLNTLQEQIDKMNRVIKNFTIPAAWSSSKPYTITVSCAQATGADSEIPKIDIAENATEAQDEAFGYIKTVKSIAGALQFVAPYERPTVAININVFGV